ncbi:MAG: hypothetical protein E7012_04310 [Alphaproteobacteria bacterium]|nr:hypothetical protein [Alphaproteobacteria bacterium]
MNKYVISVSILLLSLSSSLAQDSCMVRPSCADMGYTKSATDCVGKKAISCPFDLSAYYCPEVGESCDFSEYPLTECPTGGNCTEFECGGTTQYKLDNCQNSYELSSDGLICNACNFTNYPLSTCDANGTCSNYKCGNITKYKLDSCNSGYEISSDNTTCTACNFTSYPLSSCDANGSCSSYTCDGVTKYKLNSCKSGYYKSGNTCIYDPCYYAVDLDCDYDCAYYNDECNVCEECMPDCDSICIDEDSCIRGLDFDITCDCYTSCCEQLYTCEEACADEIGTRGCLETMCICGEDFPF